MLVRNAFRARLVSIHPHDMMYKCFNQVARAMLLYIV